MNGRRVASGWHLATAAIAVLAIITQLVLVIRGTNVLVTDGVTPGTATRVVRFFSYFTVQSNVLVAIVAATLAVRPDRDGRWWRVLRLAAQFGITVTGIVYVTLLRPIVNLEGIPKLTDVAFHYVVPVVTVLGWLLFGPRPRIDDHTLVWSLVWPVAYIGYVLVYGEATGWYPYPFVDVGALGYVTTLRNAVGITVLFLGVGTVYLLLDKRLRPSVGASIR
jgi:hypothetical protein